jgi:hypothetical protein
MKYYATPELAARIEATAKQVQPSDEYWIPPFDDEDEQPEPPDRGAPPPGDDTDATTIGDLQVHPAAEIFLRMSEAEFVKHRASVEEHGQLVPILVSPDRMILDGCARARACHELGIEPRTEVKEGDPMKIVIAANRHRKHMTPAMLAKAAYGLTRPSIPRTRAPARGDIELIQADTRRSSAIGDSPQWRKPVMTQTAAADEIGINVDQIRTYADFLKARPLQGIIDAIDDGRIKTVHHALSIVTPDEDEKRVGMTSEQKQKFWLKDPRNIQFKARRRRPPGPTLPITAGAIEALSDAERFALMDELAPGANRYGAVEGWLWQRVKVGSFRRLGIRMKMKGS